MSQTNIYNNQANLEKWIDLRYADLANQIIIYQYYYVGSDISIYDLILTEGMYDLITSGNVDDCIACVIGSNLDKYKFNYCEDSPLVTSCEL